MIVIRLIGKILLKIQYKKYKIQNYKNILRQLKIIKFNNQKSLE